MTSESTTSANTTSGRVRTSFDPDSELPRLHKWFAENPHPSRLTLQLYVKELNGLNSRKSRKLLEVHNLCYWFKNARAAYKRAELRMKKNHGIPPLEQNHHLHHHHPRNQHQLDNPQQLQKRSLTSPKCHQRNQQPQQQSSSSLHHSLNHNQDNDHHNPRHNHVELQQQKHEQKHIQCRLQNAASLINQHRFQILADQQPQLGVTNCPGLANVPRESSGTGCMSGGGSHCTNTSHHNVLARSANSGSGSPIYMSDSSQQVLTSPPTSPGTSTHKPATRPLIPSMQTSPTICSAPTHSLVHPTMLSSSLTDGMQTGSTINMANAMTTGCPVNFQSALQQQLTAGPSQLHKANSYSSMDLANALDCILSRAKSYTAAAAAAAVLAAANNPMANTSQVAANHAATTAAAVAASNYHMSPSTGQFFNQNLLNVAAAAISSPSSSTSIHTKLISSPMGSPIAAHNQYQQQQSLSCPNSFLLGRRSGPDTSASLTSAHSGPALGLSHSIASGLDHINHLTSMPNLLEHNHHFNHQQQHIQQPPFHLFTTFNPSNHQFALGMLDDKQLDSNVLNSMAFPTSAHPQLPSPDCWH